MEVPLSLLENEMFKGWYAVKAWSYLGVNWFLRKMISFASVTKVLSHTDGTQGAYDLANLTSKKNTIYKNWKLNEEFEAEGLDGRMHKVRQVICWSLSTVSESVVRDVALTIRF